MGKYSVISEPVIGHKKNENSSSNNQKKLEKIFIFEFFPMQAQLRFCRSRVVKPRYVGGGGGGGVACEGSVERDREGFLREILRICHQAVPVTN